MPTSKKQKVGSRPKAQAASDRPSKADLEGDGGFAQLAKQHWLKNSKRASKVQVKNDVLKREIWDPLEKEGFPIKSLLVLEGLQILESYLWPGFSDDSSDFHVLLIVLIVNAKRRERLETWQLFDDRAPELSSLFKRVLSMSLDHTASWSIRTHILVFIIESFQSLDHAIVRKECAPLVAISIWHNLSTAAKRDAILDQDAHLKKVWRAAAKRFGAADDPTKARLRFERSWLYTLVVEFLGLLHSEDPKRDAILYCERFLEFLSDLLAQLPTRRYVNTLLQDLHVISAIELSPAFKKDGNSLLRELTSMMSHYVHFTIDDQTGVQLSRTEAYDRHCANLARLQRAALKSFPDKLTVLALSNYASIDKREELETLLRPLEDDELSQLATMLELRTSYPETSSLVVNRSFLLEILTSSFEKRKTFQETAQSLSTLPTEKTLFDRGFLRADSYDGSRPLPLPKLNLQYLSVGDFLWRSFILYRCESFYGIRRDIEDVLRRLKPEAGPSGTTFHGFSRMALPISRPSVLEVVPALVGDDTPSVVRAEVVIDVRRLADNVRRDWDSLRPDDAVFLLHVDVSKKQSVENGDSHTTEAQRMGLVTVRTAEIAQILDHGGRSIRDAVAYFEGRDRSHTRRLQLKLDARSYKEDMARVAAGKPNVYDGINLIVRRSGRENNFKPILESIRGLTLAEVPLPPWLYEVFLGYGDPAVATYKNMPNRIGRVDYRDTFLDWQHLVESLPGRIIEPSDDASGSFGPPYVLETVAPSADEVPPPRPSKKRRRGEESAQAANAETVKVSTYKPPNNGPYPVDAPRLNTVRFTPAQVEAVVSGTQPGLTVVVGPPGTGKTDVATQVINLLYHNFPEQKTLLIAHSNQALNQLFAKIAALDIDERHLLRLGHGEEELDMEGSFSKHGRVESFLENRDRYLMEVNRLAASIGAPGAHGNSAETAGYFNKVYIEPAWAKFTEVARLEEASPDDIVHAFPFLDYFADAPPPLFPPGADKEAVLGITDGCYRHISRIFSELADVLPFEILRRDRDKANYLLTNEARIIAMTSTHAAMRRGEIASLGFHYDNVVMEEAAQITEIESFIPLAMQKAQGGGTSLQRVVLCGDHFQNSPIIQSLAFRNYAGLEQSLFARLVRLGMPIIQLDQQGRARPSLARLYHWRYPYLGNLPHVERDGRFLAANAGFKYDYQFVNVPDYKGVGEREPVPHFLQNLGEAEYAVAIYQYMRLLGYPASQISILTTYAGQRALVRDILAYRCAKSPMFGLPRVVTTVDKYQGEQNDYIILSLTRTTKPGYLRDLRRLTVALSRARLGLYILGRREVFESCIELRDAFELLLKRPDKLVLVTGEMWPCERSLTATAGEDGQEEDGEAVPGEAVMEGVEHLGQFVFEMTATRGKQLRREMGLPEVVEEEEEEEGATADGDGARMVTEHAYNAEAVGPVADDENGEEEEGGGGKTEKS